MGGKHRGEPIKLDQLLVKEERLKNRISRMFQDYAKKCKSHIPWSVEHPARCTSDSNNTLTEFCGRHYTLCDMNNCPDRKKI